MGQVRTLQVGDVLRASFGVCRRNLVAVVVLAVVTYFLPMLVFVALYPLPEPPAVPPPPQDPAQSREHFLEFFAELRDFYERLIPYWLWIFFCYSWIQGGLTYLVVRSLRGGAPSVRESLWQSVRAIPRAVAVGAPVGLAVFAGLLLFIVPGIVLALVFWVAVPAAVVERRFGSALRRSHELARGHKVPLFGLLILLVVIQTACTLVFVAIATDVAPGIVPFTNTLVGAVTTSFLAMVTAVCYHDLRVLKEGADTAVAKVFE